MTHLWTVDQAADRGDCKFVIVNDEVRLFDQNITHSDMVATGEKATDAGYILIKRDRVVMADGYSTSLRVHCTSRGEALLAQLFGKPVVGRLE